MAGLVCAEEKSISEILFLQYHALAGDGFVRVGIHRADTEEAGGGCQLQGERVGALIGYDIVSVEDHLVSEIVGDISVRERDDSVREIEHGHIAREMVYRASGLGDVSEAGGIKLHGLGRFEPFHGARNVAIDLIAEGEPAED